MVAGGKKLFQLEITWCLAALFQKLNPLSTNASYNTRHIQSDIKENFQRPDRPSKVESLLRLLSASEGIGFDPSRLLKLMLRLVIGYADSYFKQHGFTGRYALGMLLPS